MIKPIINGKILIINYDRLDGYSQYIINAVNTNNDKTVAIRIEYDKKDEVQAQKIAEQMIANMRSK